MNENVYKLMIALCKDASKEGKKQILYIYLTDGKCFSQNITEFLNNTESRPKGDWVILDNSEGLVVIPFSKISYFTLTEEDTKPEIKSLGSKSKYEIVEETKDIELLNTTKSELSSRARHVLLAHDIITLEKLLRFDAYKIRSFDGCGADTLLMIKKYVEQKGYWLGCLSPIWLCFEDGFGRGKAQLSSGKKEIKFPNYDEAEKFVEKNNRLIYEKEKQL